MKFKDLYTQLTANKYYVFSSKDIGVFYSEEGAANINVMLSRWKKKGWVLSLKKGIYELSYPGDYLIPDLYIANRLYAPSYVSLETALSNYNIIPEVSMTVTSITTKPTRRFTNKHGLFIYRTISSAAFSGYYIEEERGFPVFIAEPEKAFVDYLYFKVFYDKSINLKEARIDWGIVSKLNKRKMARYANLYNLSLRSINDYI